MSVKLNEPWLSKLGSREVATKAHSSSNPPNGNSPDLETHRRSVRNFLKKVPAVLGVWRITIQSDSAQQHVHALGNEPRAGIVRWLLRHSVLGQHVCRTKSPLKMLNSIRRMVRKCAKASEKRPETFPKISNPSLAAFTSTCLKTFPHQKAAPKDFTTMICRGGHANSVHKLNLVWMLGLSCQFVWVKTETAWYPSLSAPFPREDLHLEHAIRSCGASVRSCVPWKWVVFW